MNSWQLYWITRLDQLYISFSAIFAFSLLGMASFGSAYLINLNLMKSRKPKDGDLDHSDYDWNKSWADGLRPFAKLFVSIFIFSNILWFIPTTKEMAAIIIIPKLYNSITTNQKIINMPDKLLDLANSWIEELKPEKDKK